MSDIKLETDTHDLEVINGELSLTEGLEARSQHLKQRMGMFFGEWFLNTLRGIPYVQQVFKKNPNPVVIDSIFKNEIVSTQGVLELQTFSLDLEETTRELTVSFKARTDDGILVFEETFGV